MDSPASVTQAWGETSQNAQSVLIQAPKSPTEAGYATRSWSLFFFFRILRKTEMAASERRVAEALAEIQSAASAAADGSPTRFLDDKSGSKLSSLKLDCAFPAVLNAGLVAEARAEGTDEDDPAAEFRTWLEILTREHPVPAPEGSDGDCSVDELTQAVRKGDFAALAAMARDRPAMLHCLRAHYPEVLREIRRTLEDGSAEGALTPIIVFELLRQGAALFVDEDVRAVLRGGASAPARLGPDGTEQYDRTPITMAFSFPGLRALKIDPTTLASFPDAFQEGMAARAARLGDTGRNAPEHWEGELGLRTVHGYFTGSSNLDHPRLLAGKAAPLSERFWKALRREIRLFNDPSAPGGADLRALINLVFKLVGLEIVHIELGQDPYRVERETVIPLAERKEHFGFRDGISQPFVDLGLDAPAPGGGTASRRGTWTPVAPGEIFLDRANETGFDHVAPLDPILRTGSTYLVFRKLEQDVEGFRAFLAQQRPDDAGAQAKLAAQFVGRWPNGTPLVHSPHCERNVDSDEAKARLNDFRYGEDDSEGRKCPLGAHIRRANPRDIGGRDDVRHHRILRRGIAYGGPLLGPDRSSDGEPRGILFVAANASIDLQFEVIQGDWLSGGEFLGQVGMGRCPISGGNDGGAATRFLESGASAPVTGLPNFVTVRGGDYFFAPGVGALKAIAAGKKFEVSIKDVPFRGHTMNDASTPSLFGEKRIKAYSAAMLETGQVLRVKSRHVDPDAKRPPETVAFVGCYDQVAQVLKNEAAGDAPSIPFSVEPYLTAGERISRGETFLVGTEDVGPTKDARERVRALLAEGWRRLDDGPSAHRPSNAIAEITSARLDAAIARAAGSRRIDLIDDLAVQAAYGVVENVLGVRGPSWLTELAIAVAFSRQHVGDVPPDWLAAIKVQKPADPGLVTMQIWSTLIIADLTGNFGNMQALQAVARQAGTEMLNHIDLRLFEARGAGPVKQPKTLLESFLSIAQDFATPNAPPHVLVHYAKLGAKLESTFIKDVSILLLELVGTTLAAIPITFGSVMTALLDRRIDLSLLLPRLSKEDVGRIIYEGERLNPNNALRGRRCTAATVVGNSSIEKGDFVAAIISAANMDPSIFKEPQRFSLAGCDPLASLAPEGEPKTPGTAPDRNLGDYLLFGVTGSKKECWGRDRVAMPVLIDCLHACGRLRGLRKVAGRAGEPKKIGSVTVGLPARFRQILPKNRR